MIALAFGLLSAFALRLLFLPLPGLAGDLTDFVRWAGAIARDGLGHAYDEPISFPPVLPWLWAAIGALVPPIGDLPSAQAVADPLVRAAMKAPAALADLGLAVGVAYALRARPMVAVAGGLALAFMPAGIYLSAWWGQIESLYVLPVLVGYLLAIRGRIGWAGVAMAIALMTKPQALPLAVPFIAYAVGRGGWRALLAPVLTGGATIALLWLPFLAAGGPARYLDNLRAYGELFSVISLRAWNPWWLVQLPAGTEGLIADTNSLAGPVTYRVAGIVIALLLGAAIAAWVARRPTPESLAWGLVTVSLAAFCALTTMHERYAYPAIALLPLLWPDRRAAILWAVLSVLFTLNLVASVPPGGGPGTLIPVDGILGAAGSLLVTVCLGGAMFSLRRVTTPARAAPDGALPVPGA